MENKDGFGAVALLGSSRRFRGAKAGQARPPRRERGRHSTSLGDSASRMNRGRYPHLLERLLSSTELTFSGVHRHGSGLRRRLERYRRAIRPAKHGELDFRAWKSGCWE